MMGKIYFLFIAIMFLAVIAESECMDIEIPKDETGISILSSNYHGTGIYEVQTGGFLAIDEIYVGVLDITHDINTSAGVFRICVNWLEEI